MIEVSELSVRQGTFALAGVSFTVATGQYAVLMGKSGCGKTTILEAIAGLRPIASGAIRLADRDVTRLRPAARHVGYVPQDAALFTTMTVRDNLGFALDVCGEAPTGIASRVEELAEWLELRHLLACWPHTLSGGEKQRVALGRALASRPPVLLLDEPLGGLDDETRDHLVDVLHRVRSTQNVTVLHVTHNRSEATRLGDVVLRFEGDRVRSV